MIQAQSAGVYKIESAPGVLFAFSGREFTAANRDTFLKELNTSGSSLKCVRQVHGDAIVEVKSLADRTDEIKADALITNLPGAVLAILTADCVPVFLYDPVQKAAGLIHAGWRGLHQEILPKTLDRMKRLYGSAPENLQVAIGPAIRVCCYEVGREFEGIFPMAYRKAAKPGDKDRMDLIAETKRQSSFEGINSKNVQDVQICTACDTRFFSFRREKTDERILSILQIL